MNWDIWVDFNDVDDNRRVLTLLRFARPGAAIHPGAIVWAGDDEGNRCKVQVMQVSDKSVVLQLDIGTFEAVTDSAPHAAYA